MRTARFYRMLILLLVMQMAFVAVLNRSAGAAPLGTIIHQDGFTVDGVERQYGEPLTITTVEGSSQRWNAPTGMEFADIDGEDVVRAAWGSGNGAVIDCDLALVGGTIKIEVDAMTLGAGSSDNWVAIGFQPETTPAWVVSGSGGISMLFRGNGGYQIFAEGGVIDDDSDDPVTGYTPGDVTDMSITYDSATNTATFVINGQVVFASGDLGTAFADAAKRPFATTYDTGMYVDNFTVSMEGGTLPAADIFLQSPADNTWHVDRQPELSWGTAFDVDENTTFDVYLDPNDLPVNNLDSSALVSSQTGLRYTPDTPLTGERTYYWRIVTKVDGTVTQTSEVRSFLTDSEDKKWSDAPWMTDDDLDLSTGKIYTHKVNFNAVSDVYPTSVLGIDFESDTDRVGENWSLSGAGSAHLGTGGDAFYGTGEGVILNTPFYYGNEATLTLTGLTPGEEYRTTFYTHAWGGKGGRFVDVTTSDDGKVRRIDENVGGNNRGWLFMYTYTAPESGELAFDFNVVPGSGGWHHYSFTNEIATDIYLEPTPVPWWAQVPSDVDLSWELIGEVAGTLSYHLSVATDPNVLNLVVDTDLSESTYPASLTPDMTYYWQVVVMEDGAPVHESPVWDFEAYEFQKWFDASWMTDDDLDLSSGKTYTHKVNFNPPFPPTIVLGVDFEDATTRIGDNWLLTDTPNAHGGTVFTGTGEGRELNTGFFYGAPSTLTLTGLTAGVEYRTTFYTHGWGTTGERRVDIKTSDDGWTQRQVDENFDGNGNGHLFMYYYTGPDSGSLTFEFSAIIPANTWHHYSFTNEIVADIYLDPTPAPGASIAPEVLFGWQLHGEVADARYNLLVATDSGMQNLVVNESGLSVTEIRKSLTPLMDYWWQVEVTEGQGGPVVYESPVWDFTTSPPPDAEKVLEWKMDETAGPIAYQTGTSEDADGILSGFNDPNLATFVPGLVGNGLLLNGTSEYVDISNAYPFMPTGNEQAFAVSAYFRTFKEYGPIFSMRNEANGTPLIDITIGHDGARESAGRVRLLVRDDGGALGPDANSGILVNDGRWHSLVVMRSRGNWTMYVDGIKRAEISGVASGAVTLDWLAIGASKMWIFADHGSWSWQNTHIRYFKGILDEVCVWAGEMQPSQIEAHAAIVPPAGDMDFDLDTDEVDLGVVTDNWLVDSYTPVQSSPLVLEDMESYTTDPNTYKMYWEALEGVSLESVGGNVDTAPGVGLSLNSIQADAEYGQVLQWDYDFEGQSNVMERFWLRDRRVDLGLYDQISIRVKKLAGSTGDQLYFDFHDGRGMTELEFGDPTRNLHWKGRVILPLGDLPEDQWVTLPANIPSELSGRTKELNDFYELSIGISMGTSGTTGTVLIDEIVLTDASEDCFPEVGVLLPDMNGDCLVNINDFAIMAGNWLQGL